jgi:hypothetical protein
VPDLDKLLNAIDLAESTAFGSDGDGELAADRARSISIYQGKNIWPAPEGRSQIVDRTAYETVQWMLPSLMGIFASGEDIVELPPIGPEDEEGAKQEGEYLNWLVTQKNDWFNIFYEWITDALITKNAYCIARRESRAFIELETYERQTPEGLSLLTQDKDAKIIQARQYPDEDSPPQPVIDPMTQQPAMGPDGQPMMAPPPMLFDVTIRRTQSQKSIRLYVLPPERCKVSEKTPSWKLQDCDYFEWWESKTISELRQEGFQVEDDIAADEDPDTLEDHARDDYEVTSDDMSQTDPAMRRVKARFVWIRHDYDEDGIAELQYCVVVGKQILLREEVARIPVACIVTKPRPHRHMGDSEVDAVADIQATKTVLIRGGLDNLQLSNNPQKVVDQNRVNLDDALLSRPGALVRVDGPAGLDAYRHETPPFVFPQAMEALGFMEQVTEGRSGVNRYFQGTDQNAMNKTASGVQQLSTMAAQRVQLIARIAASGVEDLFSIVHELILKGGHKKETIQLRGKWVEVDPAAWRRRSDFKIKVGFAAGNKDAMVSRLMLIGQLQEKAMAGGLPIVTPENIYRTAMEITKASDFSSPDGFWTDPSTVPPQPPPPNPLIEAEKIKAETTVVTKKAEIDKDMRVHAEDAMLGKYKIDTDNQTKIVIEQMRIEAAREQSEADRAHQTDLADSHADLELHRDSQKAKA